MAEEAENSGESGAIPPVVIRKYANRRLYSTATGSFVTLEDLRGMVTAGQPFTVIDAKSGRDITSSVLAQIIADQETRGEKVIPDDVLRQIISFYEKGMSESVSSYLQKSMDAFTENWQQAQRFGEMGRKNMEIFQQSLTAMFAPTGAGRSKEKEPEPAAEEAAPAGDVADDVRALQEQLRAMQEKLESLSAKPRRKPRK